MLKLSDKGYSSRVKGKLSSKRQFSIYDEIYAKEWALMRNSFGTLVTVLFKFTLVTFFFLSESLESTSRLSSTYLK